MSLLSRLAAGFAVIVAAAQIGCATISQGTHTDVEIRSRPSKAEIFVDGVAMGRTPAKISMEASQAHTVILRAPGHKDATIRTERVLTAGFIVVDILLGIIPVFIDAATGAWYAVQPSPMNVILQPLENAVANGDETP